MDESILLIAEALAQSEVDAGVQRAVDQLPKQPVDFDGLCEDCRDEIPAARIKFGAVTCVDCQKIREESRRPFKAYFHEKHFRNGSGGV